MSKILIVEDDISIAELEKDYLELSSFEVQIAGDGESGWELARQGGFDLYILDVMLPHVLSLTAEGKPIEYQTDGRIQFLTSEGETSEEFRK